MAAELNTREAGLEVTLAYTTKLVAAVNRRRGEYTEQAVDGVGIKTEVSNQVCQLNDEREVSVEDGVAAEEGTYARRI